MNLTITGRHMDLTEALKAYVDNGLRKLRTHFDKMIDTENSTYDLKLPPPAMEKFVANKYPILNESVQLLLTEPENVADILKKQQTTYIK